MPTPRPLAAITGASSGIGATFARTLAAGNYDLLLIARRRALLEGLAQELTRNFSVRAEALAADLTRDEDVALVAQRLSAAETLELLVNNAGFGTRGRFFEAQLDAQDRMHRLHVLATMRLTHAALPAMVVRNRGAIVNVSSVAGFTPTPGNVSYCATKAWMNYFTEGLHMELRSIGSGVKVQALCPGFTYSEFHDTMGVSRETIPASLWMPAQQVVNASLEGLKRGKLYVVPGWRYRAFVALLSWVPRGLRFSLAQRYSRRAKRY